MAADPGSCKYFIDSAEGAERNHCRYSPRRTKVLHGPRMTSTSPAQTLWICWAPGMAPVTQDGAPAPKHLKVLASPKRRLEILISQIRNTDLIQEHRTADWVWSNGVWGFEVQECQTIRIMLPETHASMRLRSMETAPFDGGFSNSNSNFFFFKYRWARKSNVKCQVYLPS